jgi:hypothetical protein
MAYAALDTFICSDARRLAVPVSGAAGVWRADRWTKSDFAGKTRHKGDSAVFCGFGLSGLEPELSGDEETVGGVFLTRVSVSGLCIPTRENGRSMVVRRLIAEKVLPAKQIVKFAPWMIDRHHLQLPAVRKAIRIVHSGRRVSRITSNCAQEVLFV